jgi:hypothetical protein
MQSFANPIDPSKGSLKPKFKFAGQTRRLHAQADNTADCTFNATATDWNFHIAEIGVLQSASISREVVIEFGKSILSQPFGGFLDHPIKQWNKFVLSPQSTKVPISPSPNPVVPIFICILLPP